MDYLPTLILANFVPLETEEHSSLAAIKYRLFGQLYKCTDHAFNDFILRRYQFNVNFQQSHTVNLKDLFQFPADFQLRFNEQQQQQQQVYAESTMLARSVLKDDVLSHDELAINLEVSMWSSKTLSTDLKTSSAWQSEVTQTSINSKVSFEVTKNEATITTSSSSWTFICLAEQCASTFPSIAARNSHMHWQHDFKYTCIVSGCEPEFDSEYVTESHLWEHEQLFHSDATAVTALNCKNCFASFGQMTQLANHFIDNHVPVLYDCPEMSCHFQAIQSIATALVHSQLHVEVGSREEDHHGMGALVPSRNSQQRPTVIVGREIPPADVPLETNQNSNAAPEFAIDSPASSDSASTISEQSCTSSTSSSEPATLPQELFLAQQPPSVAPRYICTFPGCSENYWNYIEANTVRHVQAKHLVPLRKQNANHFSLSAYDPHKFIHKF